MTATLTRTRLLVALVAISTLVLALAAAGGVVPGLFVDDSPDRPDDPTTEDTVGYVNGYWYDDELPVDDRDDAVVDDDELEPVVYRSMARVEKIRNMTFEDDVPVEVISREEYQTEHKDIFLETTEDEQLIQNVTYETLFMVDRDTDAGDEFESMYGGAVGGYYDPETDRIVVVSDTTETPELDETVLGHELVHALQDQQFDLSSYDRMTIDQDVATNGLIEGDAAWVETEYETRCSDEWACAQPGESEPNSEQFSQLNWGLYMTLYQPYNDGSAYIDSLREDGGWAAVNAAYDDPPTSSSTVIHSDEEREPVEVTVEDRSGDAWVPLEVDGEPARQTVGEAAMVSMFGADIHDRSQPSVIDSEAMLADGLSGYDYDQPYTDGWTGDELAVYVDATVDDPTATDTGYVWETEWRSSEDAQQFVTGYLDLLEIHDAEPVADRQDTYTVDDEYPGAYAIDRDGETVTIVRAPSVDDLDEINDGAAPEGDDTLERVAVDTSDGDDGGTDDDDSDSLAGFAVPGTVLGVSIGIFVAKTRDGTVRAWIAHRRALTRPDSAPSVDSGGGSDSQRRGAA
ncbi:Hvo_1808 family surface protein [Natronorubrum thiooxidans]|nr:Hvo_1808 family surface protein [Natronorubrum thiooxidans]